MSVSRDRSFSRSDRQKFVHLSDASDFVTRGVDGKDEDKDDREEYSSVGAAFAKKLGYFGHLRKNGDILVTEQGGSHTTNDNIDCHTDRDQEASCDRIHSREISDGRGTTQDEHGRNDDVRGQPKKCPLKMALGGTLLLKGVVPEEHENEVSKFSPTSADDLEPGVSVRGIKLKLGRKLVGHMRSS